MNFKKLVSLILTVMFLVSCMPTGLADTGTVAEGICGENLTWVLDSEGTLTISGEGKMDDYESPSASTVPWHNYVNDIKTVIVENGVTTIGDWAFEYCYNLISATIPNSVTTIGDYVFCGCASLTSITISDSLTTIGNYAFSNCTSLTGIIIPDGVTTIGESAFGFCYNLTSVTIPNSVTTIGNYAFYGCERLTDVYYGGTGTEWNAILIGEGNEPLTNVYEKYLVDRINNCTSLYEMELILNEMHTDANLNNYSEFDYYFRKYQTLSKKEIVLQQLLGDKYDNLDTFVERFIRAVEDCEEMERPIAPGAGGGSVSGGGGGGYVPSLPDEDEFDTFTIGMNDVKGRAGNVVTVPVYVMKNPGVTGLQLSVDYDDRLAIIGVHQSVGEENSALESLELTQPGDMNIKPLTILMDGMEADNTNGYFVYLDFAIPEGAEDDTVYDIRVSVTNSYVFDNDLNSVEFAVREGSITVQNYTIGDINDDGIINIKDITLLRRGVAGGYGVTLNKAADVNVDGITNILDITLIRRFIAGGYGVVLES